MKLILIETEEEMWNVIVEAPTVQDALELATDWWCDDHATIKMVRVLSPGEELEDEYENYTRM